MIIVEEKQEDNCRGETSLLLRKKEVFFFNSAREL